MTYSDKDPSITPDVRTPREEEQFLCNEALRTGDFDTMSDSAWVVMCENASKGEKSAAS